METIESEPGPELILLPEPPRFPMATAFGLIGASFVASVLMIPYTQALLAQMKMPGVGPELMPIVHAIDVLFETGISTALIVLGLWSGGKIGLGTPLLPGLDGTPEGRARAWKAVGLSAALGVLMGVLFLVGMKPLNQFMPEKALAIKSPSAGAGFLASLGAGVREEVWLRLGVMTFLAWIGSVVTRRSPPTAVVIWIANVLAALLFAAMHLPQAAGLIGLTPAVLLIVFVGNGVPGVVFGWLYWRKGLVAAMVSHFMIDVVLKVVVPLLER
jgi:membrane protease YdiL (CAAX protease family)